MRLPAISALVLLHCLAARPLAAAVPAAVTVSNVNDRSFVVSWTTASPADGWVAYGRDAGDLDKLAHDVRGPGHEGVTHYVRLENLAPETAYYFRVLPDGTVHSQSTAPGLYESPPLPGELRYGQVARDDGGPAAGALVYFHVSDGDGQGSSGRSQLRSALVCDDGWWNASLGTLRTETLNDYFEYTPAGGGGAGDTLHFVIDGGPAGTWDLALNTTGAETPTMTLVPDRTLTVTVDGAGTVAVDPDRPAYRHADRETVTLVPEPGAHYRFSHWSGALSGAAVPGELVMDADRAVTAHFVLQQHRLTVEDSLFGAVTPGSGDYDHGTEVELTAVPDPGYYLVEWTGALAGETGLAASLVIDQPLTVGAVFARHRYTVDASQPEDGSVTPGQQEVYHGEAAVFTVTADTGFYLAAVTAGTFTRAGENTWTWTIDGVESDQSVAATLARVDHTVTVEELEHGTVDEAVKEVSHGGSVTFTLTPEAGYYLSSLSEGVSVPPPGEYADSYQWTISEVTGDLVVSAAFSLREYLVTVAPLEHGSVDETELALLHGEPAVFTLTPADGYYLAGVSAGDTAPAPGDYVGQYTWTIGGLTGDLEVSATFARRRYLVTVAPLTGGSVDETEKEVSHGDSVTFTLTPDAGYYLDSLTAGTAAPPPGEHAASYQWTISGVTEALEISAAFALRRYALTIQPPAHGEITVAPPGGEYEHGQLVTLTASPHEGFHLVAWTGALAGEDALVAELVIDGPKTVGADFARNRYPFTLDNLTPGRGIVTLEPEPVDGRYEHGQAVTLVAVPEEGFALAAWGGDLAGRETPRVVNISGPLAVTARFAQLAEVTLATGWNLLALPLMPDPRPRAADVVDQVAAAGGDLAELVRWSFGAWEGHVAGVPANNFTLAPGAGYFARAARDGNWLVEGEHYQGQLEVEIASGWNLVGLPAALVPDGFRAADLLASLNEQGLGAREVVRWTRWGEWEGHLLDLPFNNFPVEAGAGYFVRTTAGGTWRLGEALPGEAPRVRVSNVGHDAFVVSWESEAVEGGQVRWGTDPDLLDRVAGDARGAGYAGTTHYVPVNGLAPETDYWFEVVSGGRTYRDDDQPWPVRTGPVLDPGTPAYVYGQVFEADGVTPATGAVVYFRLRDADGAGTAGDSQWRSVLLAPADDGWWQFDRSGVRTASLDAYFTHGPDDSGLLEAAGGARGAAQLAAPLRGLVPAAAMVLDGGAPPGEAPRVRVSNVGHDAFVVSWESGASESGQVRWGTDPNLLDRVAGDARGAGHAGTTHYVPVNGLAPATDYWFEVVSGGRTYRDDDQPWPVRTGPVLDPGTPAYVYGRVLEADGVTPAAGTVVYFRLRDDDGAGTAGDSQWRSVLLGPAADGWWQFDRGGVRTASLDGYFTHGAADLGLLEAAGGARGAAALALPVSGLAPAPEMVLE